MFHDTEKCCKTWKKVDLWFGKWHVELDKILPEHSKSSKLRLLWDPFIQSRKCMSLEFTKLCVMTMKNDAKFEEQLTCCFKIGIRNLTNFDPNAWNSHKFALQWASLTQSRNGMSLKFIDKLCVMKMKNDGKFEEKMLCSLKIDTKNWAEKVQRNYLSWH